MTAVTCGPCPWLNLILGMLIFADGGKLENYPQSKAGENQQQTQLHYDSESGNQTQATVVRGEHSHRHWL
jgi:hypothetical protein